MISLRNWGVLTYAVLLLRLNPAALIITLLALEV